MAGDHRKAPLLLCRYQPVGPASPQLSSGSIYFSFYLFKPPIGFPKSSPGDEGAAPSSMRAGISRAPG